MTADNHYIDSLFSAFSEREETLLAEYFDFLRFKTIGAETQCARELRECSHWLALWFSKCRFSKCQPPEGRFSEDLSYEEAPGDCGFQSEIWETSGHPVVFASYQASSPTAPTLLFYLHYDVQPVDPLGAWLSPPFEPEIRDGCVFARGAQDNKGQAFYIMAALRYLLERDHRLPLSVKVVFDGEEETSSASLSRILEEKKEQLRADYLLVADCTIPDENTPAVTLGIRGIVSGNLRVIGPREDLHSGLHGGIVPNPLHCLVSLLAALRDETGRVQIPQFYEDIEELPVDELSELSLDFDSDEYLEAFGASANGGEAPFSPNESRWLRPTVEVNGINGGYTGAGFKTVIPREASAKVSCRLVPNQDPRKVQKLVKEFFREKCPQGFQVDFEFGEGIGYPIRTSPSARFSSTIAKAYSETFYGNKCHFVLGGVSIPITSNLARVAGAEVALMGYGLPSDKIHAPNEHFSIKRLKMGFVTIVRLLELLGRAETP